MPSAVLPRRKPEGSAAREATEWGPAERPSDVCRPRKNPDAAALAAAKAAKAAGMTIFSVGVKDSPKVTAAELLLLISFLFVCGGQAGARSAHHWWRARHSDIRCQCSPVPLPPAK